MSIDFLGQKQFDENFLNFSSRLLQDDIVLINYNNGYDYLLGRSPDNYTNLKIVKQIF